MIQLIYRNFTFFSRQKQYAGSILFSRGKTIYDFLKEHIQNDFLQVKELRRTDRGSVILVRHKETKTPYIFREFEGSSEVYRKLLFLACPNLPRIYEAAEKDGHAAVLEEYIEGTIVSYDGICDNDRYSMLSVFPAIPEQQRQLITSRFASKESQEIIAQNMPELEKYAQRLDVVAGNYIHSLYRFFKLNAYRNEFTDIFSEPLDFYSEPLLQDFLQDEEQLREVGNFLFKAERYEEALRVFTLLTSKDQSQASDYQKLGYCHQKLGAYPPAIEAYQTAGLMQPNSWTVRHLATCHRLKGDYSQALSYYRKAAEMQPTNKTVLYQTGICLLELKC